MLHLLLIFFCVERAVLVLNFFDIVDIIYYYYDVAIFADRNYLHVSNMSTITFLIEAQTCCAPGLSLLPYKKRGQCCLPFRKTLWNLDLSTY